jgi:hypothetical protein
MDYALSDIFRSQSTVHQTAGGIGPSQRDCVPEASLAREVALKVKRPAGLVLAKLLSEVVESNRRLARSRGIRLVCYVLDQTVAVADDAGVAEKFSLLMGAAIRSAARGSVVTGQAGFIHGKFEFHLRYAREGHGACDDSIEAERISEMWSW